MNDNAGGRLKAADLKGDSRRVEKGMLMAAVDRNRLILIGNTGGAGTAEQPLVVIHGRGIL